MKMKISPVLMCLLSVMALVLVCFLVMPSEDADPHAGHDHSRVTADPHAGHDHNHVTADPHAAQATHNRAAKECFSVTKNKDGTYGYVVFLRNGTTFTAPQSYNEKPVATELSRDLLQVSGQKLPNDVTTRWAVLYNVQSIRASRCFTGVLATTENRVACLENLSGGWKVLVRDPFSGDVIAAHDLKGMEVLDGHTPDLKFALSKSNVLSVTYPTEEGKKTVKIDLKAD